MVHKKITALVATVALTLASTPQRIMSAAPQDVVPVTVAPSTAPTTAPSAPVVQAVQADYIASSAANLNTGFCGNGHNFSAATQTYGSTTTADALPVAYEKMFFATRGQGGVRENGTLIECYSQSTFNGYQNSLNSTEGVDLIGASSTAYTTANITNSKTQLHGLRAIEFGNEWDAHTFVGSFGAAAAVGATQITTSFQNLVSNMVPGSTYSVAGTGGTNTFTFVSPVSNVVGNITPALTYAVTSGTAITHVSSPTQDILNWYNYYPSIIHAQQSTFPILGPSFAAPIFGQTNFSAGSYVPNVQIMEKHDYPVMGYNPEGPLGNGTTSVDTVNHPPCSTSATSYSIYFNNCAIENAVGATSPSQYKAMESTEWSYEVVPVGSAPISGNTAAVPDNIGIHYVLRGEAMLNSQGTERVYYEGLSDCIDAPPSGFATYGLFTGGTSCSGMSTGTFAPKGTGLALMSYVNAWTDSGCKITNCTLTPSSNVQVGFSNSALPFNSQIGQFANGQVQIAMWLGEQEYDITNTGSCASTTSCALTTTPRTETVTIPNATSVQLWRMDDNSSDGMPPAANYTAPDGTPEQSLILCPSSYAGTPYFGCFTVTTLTVTNGQVSVNVDGDYEFLRATISGLSSTVATSGATPLPSVYPTGSPSPTPTPTATPTASPTPSPTASPTPSPSPTPTPVPTIGIVQVGANGSLGTTVGTQLGFSLGNTPTNANLLVAFGASDGANPASPSPTYTQAIKTNGSAADATIYYKYAGASESTFQGPIIQNNEANIYQEVVGLELSHVPSTGAYVTSVATTAVPLSGSTYTLSSITPTQSGALFAEFAFEDYAGITLATPSSGWTLIGPYRANNGSSNTDNPILIYVEYRTDTVSGTSYTAALTVTGTPSVAAGVTGNMMVIK